MYKEIICVHGSNEYTEINGAISFPIYQSETFSHPGVGEIRRIGYSQLNTRGIAAYQAAYQFGETWLDELEVCIQGNIDFAANYIAEQLY